MAMTTKRRCYVTPAFLSGAMLGVMLCAFCFLLPDADNGCSQPLTPLQVRSRRLASIPSQKHLPTDPIEKQLYIGVMTADKLLSTRALACNQTWAKHADLHEFFVSEDSSSYKDLPVVKLTEVDDNVYPPQQKAFRMLQYMCDHHIDNYRWFVRADDDSYIKVDRLRALLNLLDHNQLIYMGQPGLGRPTDKERIAMGNTYFCMGGPSVIFSRKALSGLCPHLEECLREVQSVEEDVEIGRCVTHHLGIQCTTAWDASSLFYHAYPDVFKEKPFTEAGDSMIEKKYFQKSVVLHYAKEFDIMMNIHRQYLQNNIKLTMQVHSGSATGRIEEDMSTAIVSDVEFSIRRQREKAGGS